MIKSPSPFPFPGSWALIDEDRETHLVRIMNREAGGLASISFPMRPSASGYRHFVRMDQLRDGTPLDPAEIAELAALAVKLRGAKRRSAGATAREFALRQRSIRARTLCDLLAKGVRAKLIDPATTGGLHLVDLAALERIAA